MEETLMPSTKVIPDLVIGIKIELFKRATIPDGYHIETVNFSDDIQVISNGKVKECKALILVKDSAEQEEGK